MIEWVFALLLFSAQHGGDVRVDVRAKTQRACNEIRTEVLTKLGGESKLPGTATKCVRKVR